MPHQEAIEYIDAHIEDRAVFILFRAQQDSLVDQVYVPLMVILKRETVDGYAPDFQMPGPMAASGVDRLSKAMASPSMSMQLLDFYTHPSVENVVDTWDKQKYSVVQLPPTEGQPTVIPASRIKKLIELLGVHGSTKEPPESLLVSVREPGIDIKDIMRGTACGEYHSQTQLMASGASWGMLLGCSVMILTEIMDGTQDISSICALIAIITGAVLVVTNGATYNRCLAQAEWRPPLPRD